MHSAAVETLVHQAWSTSITYLAYRNRIGSLLVEHKTSGPNQSEAFIHYTRLNAHRMKRLDNTIQLLPAVEAQMRAATAPVGWLVLTEAWCGDAANSIPVMEKLAMAAPDIDLRLVWRDENTALMDAFLTGGSRSIPKLIAFHKQEGQVLYTWGPRPRAAQEMMQQYKAMEPAPPYEVIAQNIQKWYNMDNTQSIQKEIGALAVCSKGELIA